MGLRNLLVGILFAALFSGPTFGIEDLSFEFPVSGLKEKHLDFFRYPGLMAVALENSGKRLTWSGSIKVPSLNRLVMVRTNSYPFKKASVVFQSRKGPVFHYLTEVDWDFGVTHKTIALNLAVDTSQIANNRILISVKSKWMGVLPNYFLDYV